MAGKRGIPRAVVISRLDRDNSSFEDALDVGAVEFWARSASRCILPNGSEADFSALIDVLADADADGREGSD